MIPENLLFISAQPHDIYFVWQVEVQIVNFRKFGISDRMHVLVWYPDNNKRKERGEVIEPLHIKEWTNLALKYPEVKFFFYQDKGLLVSEFQLYIPQLRPQILAKHFELYPNLKENVLFYHDSDIIFNRLPDFQKLCEDDINWQSDTSGYLDYTYLSKKEKEGKIPENEAIQKLCDIGGISLELMKSYNGKTGGAQYLLKGVDSQFWLDIEKNVILIRKAFMHSQPESINARYFSSEAAGFQSWCADMWALNMALWARGKKTDISSELDFSWATDTAETYQKKPIFHNAGATRGHTGIFYKGKWINRSPIGLNHAVKKDSASWFYVQAINDVKKINL